MNKIQIVHTQIKSVKSIHLCKSVIQTGYDILKAPGGELRTETKQ